MLDAILAYSDETADEALRAMRQLRGFPLCGRRVHDRGFVEVCVRGRGHDDGAHER